MEFLAGQKLVKKDKSEISVEEALSNKEIIGFYFSAHWCPPCRMFTPVLADMYGDLMDKDSPFEIIFISSDKSADALFDYMNQSHGDWLAVPFGSQSSKQIKDKYNIQGIPTLIIVKKDGTVVTKSGREDVQEKGPKAYQHWAK